MDAQNAAGPDETKSVAAASEAKRPDHDHGESRFPASPRPAKPPVEDARQSPLPDKDAKPNARSSIEAADDKHSNDAANSDAETIVLPGKDGHSPSKVRKVKHEDKSDDDLPSPSAYRVARDKEERDRHPADQRDRDNAKDRGKDGVAREEEGEKGRERSPASGATGTTDFAKKKRLSEKLSEKPSLPPPREHNSKDPSVSAPTSPPPKSRKLLDANSHNLSDSNSDSASRKSPRMSKDKLKGGEKLIPHKRKAARGDDDDDEDERRKARRQRTAPASTHPDSHPLKHTKDHPQKSGAKSQGHARSVSPQSRTHRRSTSSHLPTQSSSSLSQKKKRVPAPLQSTEYHSDESITGESPHPRSSKLRSLTTPSMTESTVSPAKVAPHKKHLDAHGQTFLARACARGEYDQAKQRLGERPEDLNVADYAGNTPLQIAAINGCEEIVELLINAGCNLECVNYDRDTPLLDAIDNGHLGVVKLLLDAGVNPRKANVNGEEPIDRVNDDFDNAEEIRALLNNAKRQMGDRRRTSEERNPDNRASYGPESPRQSPAVASNASAQPTSNRRAGTVRATKTSNHLLYMPMDDKTLRTAAGRGDEETVTRILQVRNGCDDSEAMVNAARGGHDVVMQLLLALGGANPDPPPVSHMPAEVATPMLAAIGQENIKVIQLLLDQNNFDPTRRFKGETYYEIARRRQGTNWKEEEDVLTNAYEEHRKARTKDLTKKSPSRREREREREDREQKRASRKEERDDVARAHKRSAASPARAGESKKKASAKPSSSPKEKRRSHDDNQSSPKRGVGKPKNDDRLPTINVSDRENSPAVYKAKVKRAESELAAVSSEGEAVKPRRKLVSKAELRGEREKQRRPSQPSSAPSLKAAPSSPHESRDSDRPDKEKLKSEKIRDRSKVLKRDQSKDRLSVSSESAKRHRSSATPPHSNNGDKDDSEVPTKKRRLDAEGKERRPKEDRPAKPTMSREQSLAKSMKAAKLSQKAAREEDERREHKAKKASDPNRRESGKSISSDKSIHVKCEDTDVEMKDAPPASQRDDAEAKAKQLQEEQEKKRAAEKAEALAKEEQKRRELEEKEREKKSREEEEAKRAEEAKRKEEEEKKRRKEEEEKKRRIEEEKEKKRKDEEERKRKEEEERKQKEEEERKRKEEEEERKRKEKEEEERKRKEEEERIRREEEERKQREEAEKKRKEEEERLRKEEEERKQKEAEEKRKREEEERLRREQQEREAAEAARRKREEEERKEREHRERQRAAREAEMRRQREEQERARLAKLPALLRWLETCPNPKTAHFAEKFTHMQGVRYDTIRPDANGTADGREQWVLNTQVALLLGEKDLSLSRCMFFSPYLFPGWGLR